MTPSNEEGTPDRRTFLKAAAAAGAAGSLPVNARATPASADDPGLRKVTAIKAPPPRHWVGDGFAVRTMLSYADDAAAASPFLLLDYAPPGVFQPSLERRGVGEHPHRGFETVTIAYQGEVEHRDSAGNQGRIGPGDVQWMTAGSGIVHEEMHGRDFTRKGGILEMAQIWVNLPARVKMSPPGYQDIVEKRIPSVPLKDGAGTVRVIAGACGDARGPAKTFTPVEMWDVELAPRSRAELEMPEGHTVILLAREGGIAINGSSRLPEGHLAILARTGRRFRIESDSRARVLVLGGEPIPEPGVGQGPFVMNTRREIEQAVSDFQAGRMGRLR
jgi:redox-sensitive bicupin YhaK (pirin superfamily)